MIDLIPTPSYGFQGARDVEHLVYIPTNRACESTIESTAREIANLDSARRERTLFVVVDNAQPATTHKNEEATYAISNSFSIPTLFLDEATWGVFRSRLCARVEDARGQRAEKLLLFKYPNYGAGPIKASLIASALGARTLHRRDSDQVIGDESGVFPLDVELRWLGAEECSLFAEGASGNIIRAVGSSLIGEPSRDRRDLNSIHEDLGVRLDKAHGSTRKRARSIPEPIVERGGAKLNRDRSGQVEMGICALLDVFRWIPEMPASSIFGVDYMQKNLVYQSSDVVLYHNRRALHQYDAIRAAQASEAAVRDYALSELRYAYIRCVWNDANALIRTANLAVMPDQARADTYASAWRAQLGAMTANTSRILGSYVDVYQDAVRSATDRDVHERLGWRLDALKREGHVAGGESLQAVRDFIDLVELWPSLCEAAREVTFHE